MCVCGSMRLLASLCVRMAQGVSVALCVGGGGGGALSSSALC